MQHCLCSRTMIMIPHHVPEDASSSRSLDTIYLISRLMFAPAVLACATTGTLNLARTNPAYRRLRLGQLSPPTCIWLGQCTLDLPCCVRPLPVTGNVTIPHSYSAVQCFYLPLQSELLHLCSHGHVIRIYRVYNLVLRPLSCELTGRSGQLANS